MESTSTVTFSGSFPACFESKEQYRAWKEIAVQVPVKLGPCADCTPEYQAKMIRERRCENSHVQFERGSDGGIEGVIIKNGWRKLSI